MEVGAKVAKRDGQFVGTSDGFAVVGLQLGRLDGALVGTLDGACVGGREGWAVGASVGDAVGLLVSPIFVGSTVVGS